MLWIAPVRLLSIPAKQWKMSRKSTSPGGRATTRVQKSPRKSQFGKGNPCNRVWRMSKTDAPGREKTRDGTYRMLLKLRCYIRAVRGRAGFWCIRVRDSQTAENSSRVVTSSPAEYYAKGKFRTFHLSLVLLELRLQDRLPNIQISYRSLTRTESTVPSGS